VKETLSYIIKDGPRSVRGYDFESAKKDMGDGRLRPSDTLPPAGIPTFKVWSCNKTHGHLLEAVEMPDILQELASESLTRDWDQYK